MYIIALCVGAIKGKSVLYFYIVHLKGCRMLYLPKCAVFARFPANTARLGKYSTLGNRQVTANIDYSPLPHYHSLPLPLLSSRRATCIIPSRRRRRAAISCIPLLPSLPFAAINNWFRRNFCVSRLFFSWLCETIASYTTIHSGCLITIALHRCTFIINYTYTSTIKQLKHRFANGNMRSRD